jgi:hypothetical protein
MTRATHLRLCRAFREGTCPGSLSPGDCPTAPPISPALDTTRGFAPVQAAPPAALLVVEAEKVRSSAGRQGCQQGHPPHLDAPARQMILYV